MKNMIEGYTIGVTARTKCCRDQRDSVLLMLESWQLPDAPPAMHVRVESHYRHIH